MQVGLTHRVFFTASEVVLGGFEDVSIVEYHAHVSVEFLRIRVIGIDHIAHFAGQIPDLLVVHHLRFILHKTRVSPQEPHSHRIGNTEFGSITIDGPLFGRQGLPQAVNNAVSGFAFNAIDVLHLESALDQGPGTIDVGMRHGATGIGLECHVCRQPVSARIGQHVFKQSFIRVGECMKKAMRSLKKGPGASEAFLSQASSAVTRLGRPAWVHAFGPCAFGQVFNDARRHAARNSQRIHPLHRAQGQGTGHTSSSAQGAKNRGGVKPGLMNFFRRDAAQASHDLRAHSDAPGQISTTQAVKLGCGQYTRHHHRTRMDGAAFKGVVIVFTMGCGAVDQCRTCHTGQACMANHGTHPGLHAGAVHGCDIIGVPSGNTQACNVNQ